MVAPLLLVINALPAELASLKVVVPLLRSPAPPTELVLLKVKVLLLRIFALPAELMLLKVMVLLLRIIALPAELVSLKIVVPLLRIVAPPALDELENVRNAPLALLLVAPPALAELLNCIAPALVMVALLAVAANPSRVDGMRGDDAKRRSGEQHRQRVPRHRPQTPPSICHRNFQTGHVALLRLHRTANSIQECTGWPEDAPLDGSLRATLSNFASEIRGTDADTCFGQFLTTQPGRAMNRAYV